MIDNRMTSGKAVSPAIITDVFSSYDRIENGGTIYTVTPQMEGLATPNSLVRIYDNGVLLTSAYSNDQGNWYCTLPTEKSLANGSHVLTAAAAGEPAGEGFSMTVYLPSPAISLVQDLVGDIQGDHYSGSTIDDTHPTLRGEAVANGLVTIYSDGQVLTTVNANRYAGWHVSVDLPPGTHHLVAVDSTGRASEPFEVTVVAPKVNPTPTIDGIYGSEGELLNEGGTSETARPTLSGTAAPLSFVTIYDGDLNHPIGTVRASDWGTWHFMPVTDLTQGTHQFIAATASSEPSAAFVIDIAAAPPASVEITGVYDGEGYSQGYLANGDTTDDTRPTLEGSYVPYGTVKIYDGASLLGTAPVGPDGRWSYTLPLSQALSVGTHVLHASSEDGAHDATFTIVIEAPPAITGAYDHVGPSQGEIASFGTTDDNQPTLRGTGVPGTTVTIRDGGYPIGTAHVNDDGSWEMTPEQPLSDGNHFFSVQSEIGTVGNDFFIGIVTQAPPAPPAITGAYDHVGPSQGEIASNGKTDDNQPTLHGTGAPGTTVTILDNYLLIGTAHVNDDGSWEMTPEQPLRDGNHSLTVLAENGMAGNEFFIGIVTQQPPEPPAPPAITGAYDHVGPSQGEIALAGTTDDNQPTLHGTGVPGTTVTILDGGRAIGTAHVNDDGSWEMTPKQPLSDGYHSLGVQAESGTMGNTFFIGIVTQAPPAPPAITGAYDHVGPSQGDIASNGKTDDNQPTLHGTGAPGTTVTILDNYLPIGTAHVNDDGSWEMTPKQPLSDGNHFLTVQSESGTMGNAFFIGIVTQAPPAPPAITGAYDHVGPSQGDIASNGKTDDNQPTLHGTGAPGTTVTILDNYIPIGTAHVNDDGSWEMTPKQPLSDGNHFLTVQSESGTMGNAFFIGIVTQAPPASPAITGAYDHVGPSQGEIASNGTTDDNQPTLHGTGAPGTTVTILDNYLLIGTAHVNDDGSWEMTPKQPLRDGNHSLTVHAENGTAGNEFFIGIVTQPPAPPAPPAVTGAYDHVGPSQGEIAPFGTTDDNRPTLHGTGVPGTTVTILDNYLPIGTAHVNDDGSWEMTPNQSLSDGAHSLRVQSEIGTVGNDFFIQIVTQAPPAPPAPPAITGAYDHVGPSQGEIASNGTTDDNQPTLRGTGVPGTTVTILDNYLLIGMAHVNDDGSWEMTPKQPLRDGNHSLTVHAENGTAGNEFFIQIATLPPIAIDTPPEILHVSDADHAAAGLWNDSTTINDPRPLLQGTAVPNSLVTIYDGDRNHPIGTAQAGQDGQWKFMPGTPLSEGTHQFIAATASSEPSAAFVIDIVAAAPPASVVITGVYDDVGSSQGYLANGATTDDTRPTLEGSYTPNGTVVIYDGAKFLATVPVGPDGHWSYALLDALSDGTHVLHASSENGAPDATFTIVIDTQQAPPAITGAYDHVGPSQGEIASNGTTDDSRPTLRGTGAPGTTVTILDGGRAIGTAHVNDDGSWEMTPKQPLRDGYHFLMVQSENGTAGNEFFIGIVTQQELPAITGAYDHVGPSQGDVAQNGTTDDNRPTLHGTGEPGTTVTILDGGRPIGTAYVNDDGSWEMTSRWLLSDGYHTLIARSENGDLGDSFSLHVDTKPPIDITTPPEFLHVSDADHAAAGLWNDSTTISDPQPLLQGKAVPNSLVTIYDGDRNHPIGTALADRNGQWKFMPDTPLSEGAHHFIATTEHSAPSAEFTVTIVAAPASDHAPVINSLYDYEGVQQGTVHQGGTTDATHPTLFGTGVPNSIVTIYDGDHVLGSTRVYSDGNWNFTPDTALGDGLHNLIAAGADGATSTPFTVTIDSAVIPPITTPVLSIDVAMDNVGVYQGALQNGAHTDDTTPTLQGSAAANSMVIVADGTHVLGTAVANEFGQWRFTPEQPLEPGAHPFTVTDAQGGRSAPYAITIDTPTSAPVIDHAHDNAAASQGDFASGGVVHDTHPTLVGYAPAGSVVTIADGDQVLGVARATNKGEWTFPMELGDGVHHLTASTANGSSESFVLIVEAPVAINALSVADVLHGGETELFAVQPVHDDASLVLRVDGDQGNGVVQAPVAMSNDVVLLNIHQALPHEAITTHVM
ncbi:hypothetical protein ISP15_14045 [Dyella jejuensis]|uniref:Bacterial Ig-like domain-containing protein n=1 Tax=Dyella jejuensis TaxID=1432009 RepID=A0ABW8JNX4_9GAMM